MKLVMIALSLLMLAGCAHRDRKPSYDYSVLSDSQREQLQMPPAQQPQQAQAQPQQPAKWFRVMRAVGNGITPPAKTTTCTSQYLGSGQSKIVCH